MIEDFKKQGIHNHKAWGNPHKILSFEDSPIVVIA